MAKGVFIYRSSSDYDDDPTSQYQFPSRRYLSRALQLVGDWVLYLEPRRGGTRGYFAAAKIDQIVADRSDDSMHLAIVTPGSFVEFDTQVPFSSESGPVERGLRKLDGSVSGNKQAAVRPISDADFNHIVGLGLADDADILPRTDTPMAEISDNCLFEERIPFQFEVVRNRVEALISRAVRDRAFRKNVLVAYGSRCCFSGLKLINGGGRAEVEAAHIRPVEHGGPDAVANGLSLSGTAHWMFDRGLITLDDDMSLRVSRHVNDIDSVLGFLNPNRRAAAPQGVNNRPHPNFLAWHRENIFKH